MQRKRLECMATKVSLCTLRAKESHFPTISFRPAGDYCPANLIFSSWTMCKRTDIKKNIVAQVTAATETPRAVDFDWVEYMAEILRICIMVEQKYIFVPSATAAQCLEELSQALVTIGMEPDCVGYWHDLNWMARVEHEWDSFSPSEQRLYDFVPKGKILKPMTENKEEVKPCLVTNKKRLATPTKMDEGSRKKATRKNAE